CLAGDYHSADSRAPGGLAPGPRPPEARGPDPVPAFPPAPRAPGPPHPAGGGPLDSETRRFIAAASIEGEIRDAQTNVLLAEGIDRRRSDVPPHETWADVDRAFASWAERVFGRLEARTRGQ